MLQTDLCVCIFLSLSVSFACAYRTLHTRAHNPTHPPGGLGWGTGERCGRQGRSSPRFPLRQRSLARHQQQPHGAESCGADGAGRARAAGRDALRLPPAALKPPRPEGGEPRPERRFSCGPLRRGGRGASLPPPAPGSPGGRSRPWHPAVRCRSLRVPGAGSVCAPLPPPALRCLSAARAAFLGSLLPLRRGLFCCAVPGMCPRPGLRGGQGRGAEPGAGVFPPSRLSVLTINLGSLLPM